MDKRIKELAVQAGFEWELNTNWNLPDGWWKAENADLERFANLVRQDERDEIAKMFEAKIWAYESREIAVAIRARGNHGQN